MWRTGKCKGLQAVLEILDQHAATLTPHTSHDPVGRVWGRGLGERSC